MRFVVPAVASLLALQAALAFRTTTRRHDDAEMAARRCGRPPALLSAGRRVVVDVPRLRRLVAWRRAIGPQRWRLRRAPSGQPSRRQAAASQTYEEFSPVSMGGGDLEQEWREGLRRLDDYRAASRLRTAACASLGREPYVYLGQPRAVGLTQVYRSADVSERRR